MVVLQSVLEARSRGLPRVRRARHVVIVRLACTLQCPLQNSSRWNRCAVLSPGMWRALRWTFDGLAVGCLVLMLAMEMLLALRQHSPPLSLGSCGVLADGATIELQRTVTLPRSTSVLPRQS